MAAALVWPAGRLAAPGSLSRKGTTLLSEVSHYAQRSQRTFLSAISCSSSRVIAAAKKAAKERPRADAVKESGEIIWTSRAGWACVKNCGACCVLDKGPDYPPIEEVLSDPAEASLYRSMIGPDKWCINYDKRSRSCTIHADRPRFCRVEPDVFQALYGIEEKDMDKEACGFCQDQIRSVYGGRSKELKTFQRVVKSLKKSSIYMMLTCNTARVLRHYPFEIRRRSAVGGRKLVKITILDKNPSLGVDSSASSSSELAVTAVGITGNVCAFIMFFSPLPTFWTIIKRKDTGSFSGVPYVATLLNCLMWTFYGTKAVAGLMLVVTINAAGLIIESCYVFIHLIFGNSQSRKRTGGLFVGIMVFYMVVLLCVLDKVEIENRAVVVGSICVVIGSFMYSAPMTVIAQVLRDKSVENMPFFLSASSLVNSMVWAVYGILARDTFVIIPNALGVVVCIIQLMVYGYITRNNTQKGPGYVPMPSQQGQGFQPMMMPPPENTNMAVMPPPPPPNIVIANP